MPLAKKEFCGNLLDQDLLGPTEGRRVDFAETDLLPFSPEA